MVPPFTRTKVSNGGQEVTSEDRECEAESYGSSVHKDQGEYRRPGSRRRTENVRLSPLVPPFTRTKVSTGGQRVTSENREREAES
jgi:hypothetical protein